MWQVGSSQRIDWEKMGRALGFFLSACGGYQLDRRDVEVHMKWMRKRQRCGGGGGGRWRYDERRGVVGNGMKGNEWMNGWMKWNEMNEWKALCGVTWLLMNAWWNYSCMRWYSVLTYRNCRPTAPTLNRASTEALSVHSSVHSYLSIIPLLHQT